MISSFLLKYQEQVNDGSPGPEQAGLRTAPPGEQTNKILVVPLMATKTLTEVKMEQADSDAGNRCYYAIPR